MKMFYEFVLELFELMDLGTRWSESSEDTIIIVMIAYGGQF